MNICTHVSMVLSHFSLTQCLKELQSQIIFPFCFSFMNNVTLCILSNMRRWGEFSTIGFYIYDYSKSLLPQKLGGSVQKLQWLQKPRGRNTYTRTIYSVPKQELGNTTDRLCVIEVLFFQEIFFLIIQSCQHNLSLRVWVYKHVQVCAKLKRC